MNDEIVRIWWYNNGQKYIAINLGEIEERYNILYFNNGFWHRTTVEKESVTERIEDYSKELFESRKQNTNPWFRWELPCG